MKVATSIKERLWELLSLIHIWTRAGQSRGTSKDLKAVSEALSYLQRKGLSTVEDLENFIETSGKAAADYRKQMKPKETRSNVIDAIPVSYTHLRAYHRHPDMGTGAGTSQAA